MWFKMRVAPAEREALLELVDDALDKPEPIQPEPVSFNAATRDLIGDFEDRGGPAELSYNPIYLKDFGKT